MVVAYPDPEADGYDEDVGVTLENAAAAQKELKVDWDPWLGADNKPFENKPRVTRSIGEIMEIINAKKIKKDLDGGELEDPREENKEYY